MKGTSIFSVFLAVLSAWAAFAGEMEREAEELAEEVLTRRKVRVRVYNDWKQDPKKYSFVSVELDGLSFQFDAIKAAFPGINDSAVIVVAGQDQIDEAVVVSMENFIFAEPYTRGRKLVIWPKAYQRQYSVKPWAFKDAARNPVSNARVEIWLGVDAYSDRSPHIMIAEAKLDGAGLLQTPRLITPWDLFFIVHHPDCGPVRARYNASASLDHPWTVVRVSALPKDKWCVFTDGLGEPIPNATVEIFTGTRWGAKGSRPLGKDRTDEKGRLKPPQSFPELNWCHFIVSHPDYGTAIAEPRGHTLPDEPLASCAAPLVRAGTKADERSIRGTIVDPNGNPVAGAMIECGGIETPGGGHIRTPEYVTYKSLTDEQGRFFMYLPMDENSSEHGNLVPPASKYGVWIKAPKALGLQDCWAKMNSGEETTITMPPTGHGGYSRAFAFEDEFGLITDPNVLREILVSIRQETGSPSFRYDDWKNGGKFPLGTYSALIPGKIPLKFEPIEVSEDSPELLIFKAKYGQVTVYRGQVIHGITGQPMRDAIVITGHVVLAGEGAREDASSIEPEDWDVLRALALDPYADEQVLKQMQEKYNFDKIALTDKDGWYQISFTAGVDRYFSEVVALERHYLGACEDIKSSRSSVGERSRENQIRPNDDRCTQVPTMKLFPAATLILEPNLPVEPVEALNCKIRFRWSINPDNSAPWVSKFTSYFKGANIVCHRHLQPPNRVHSIHVPAGLDMTIRVFAVIEGQWCPIIVPGIKLDQGQVLDLGRLDFQPALKVALKVIDSKGEPVEGVTVQRLDEDGLFHGQKVISNEDGIAFLYVPPYSKGQFTVQYHEEPLPSKPLRESTTYQVAGEEDAGKQFVLQISDEMLYNLFK